MKRGHQTEFFLYDIENILLSGNVTLDRTLNQDVSKFCFTPNTPFQLNLKHASGPKDKQEDFEAFHISSVDIEKNSKVQVVMRMHFVVHTYINMYAETA